MHRRTTIPLMLAVAAAGCDASPPTYAGEVAGILNANCASCHRVDGPAPMPLLTYDDAAAVAPLIAEAVRSGRMPPWLPAEGDVDFVGERGLSEDEVETLVAWAEAGAPIGDSAAVPDPPEWPGGWALGEPDLVIEMADTFTVPATGTDLFRNFVVAVPGEARRWVRGIELRPGNTRVVHHAVMMVDTTGGSARMDEREPGPGFDGMLHSGGAQPPQGFYIGWTPGLEARFEPLGLAWPLEPGSDFLIQMHLRPTGQPEPVTARVGFYFADDAPDRTALLLRLGSGDMDIAPGDSAYEVTDEWTLPHDVDILGLYPHAHYLATVMEVTATTPEGEELTLLDIPDWDFNWQDVYRLEEPLRLPAGTEVRMRYVYDNSAANPQNPFDPPRRVTFGPLSSDEMAELWIQLLPAEERNAGRLADALIRKDVADRIERWHQALAIDSTVTDANYNLGNVALARGEHDRARDYYRRAIRSTPDLPQAHYNLGLALEALGDTAGAIRAYRDALRHDPEHANAYNNLGLLAVSRGRTAEAETWFRRAVAADPSLARAHSNLGNVLRERGDLDSAIAAYDAALAADPDFAQAHYNLAFALAAAGRTPEALERFDRAVRAQPSNHGARLSMAWLLATSPRDDVRSPGDAVRITEAVARTTGYGHHVLLDVLAAAMAADGELNAAFRAAQDALRLAREAGDSARAADIADRLELYRGGRPFVAPAR